MQSIYNEGHFLKKKVGGGDLQWNSHDLVKCFMMLLANSLRTCVWLAQRIVYMKAFQPPTGGHYFQGMLHLFSKMKYNVILLHSFLLNFQLSFSSIQHQNGTVSLESIIHVSREI